LSLVDNSPYHVAATLALDMIEARSGKHVRKQESEKAIRALCHQWREARGFSSTPSFTDFLAWVRQNDPRYLQFNTSTSVDLGTLRADPTLPTPRTTVLNVL
jgi:hypothetical protein